MKDERGESRLLIRVREIVSRELPPGASMPSDGDDFVKDGLIDSMGWVAILSGIEGTFGLRNFGSIWPEGRPQSIAALVEAVQKTRSEPRPREIRQEGSAVAHGKGDTVLLGGWGFALGSLKFSAQEIERECCIEPGTLREGAGIESVCRADRAEDELVLGTRAAEQALNAAMLAPEVVDVLVVTSATFLALPSFSASMHSLMLLRESCGAIDVGGACVGLLQALATAKALLQSTQSSTALVVASEVHSRRLSSPGLPGELRGLFGDGACAFVLTRSEAEGDDRVYALRDFVWGCSGPFASLLRLVLTGTGEIEAKFKGEQLASAAVSTMDRILKQLEDMSGRPRTQVGCFALHEPNPRVVEILAQRASIPSDKIPFTSRTVGNLGSATCGVSLCRPLALAQAKLKQPRQPIFMAAVGPGLLWGGTYLE